ncbi:MAG: PAS domain S-box protein, partial [Acidobacteriaceae bacterium]|nr:PAS domain S-box protein [Acidobacteriaceae bacterium]
SSPLPIVVLTRNGDVTLWNPAAERLFGWKAEEVLGGPLPFIPEEKRAEHRAMRERDLSGEGLKDVEVRRVRKDGSYIDIRVSTALLRDKNNTVTGIVSLYVDLTEQKETAREREEARNCIEQQWRLFDTALSHMPDSIYIFDRQGRFVYANKTLCNSGKSRWKRYAAKRCLN